MNPPPPKKKKTVNQPTIPNIWKCLKPPASATITINHNLLLQQNANHDHCYGRKTAIATLASAATGCNAYRRVISLDCCRCPHGSSLVGIALEKLHDHRQMTVISSIVQCLRTDHRTREIFANVRVSLRFSVVEIYFKGYSSLLCPLE